MEHEGDGKVVGSVFQDGFEGALLESEVADLQTPGDPVLACHPSKVVRPRRLGWFGSVDAAVATWQLPARPVSYEREESFNDGRASEE